MTDHICKEYTRRNDTYLFISSTSKNVEVMVIWHLLRFITHFFIDF